MGRKKRRAQYVGSVTSTTSGKSFRVVLTKTEKDSGVRRRRKVWGK